MTGELSLERQGLQAQDQWLDISLRDMRRPSEGAEFTLKNPCAIRVKTSRTFSRHRQNTSSTKCLRDPPSTPPSPPQCLSHESIKLAHNTFATAPASGVEDLWILSRPDASIISSCVQHKRRLVSADI
ncbi:hypothetical protein XPA_004241 [Xanthoria parietina]